MKPAPALRHTLVMLCGLAFLGFPGSADAQGEPGSAGDDCPLGTLSTVACVRKYMITDAELNMALARNSLSFHLEKIFSEFSAPDPEAHAAARNRLTGIVRHAELQAEEMGVASPPMYVSAIGTQAVETREGTRFILINKDAYGLAVLTDDGADRMKIGISRELAHIRNGDTSPASIVKHHNDPASSREAGLRADLEGAGPLGVRDPIAVTFAIENDLRSELHKLAFLKGNTLDDLDPNRLSDRDYKRISDEHVRVSSDIFHLAPWDRITALRKERRLMEEYEQTHAVRAHADREAESKWLVEQVLSYTQCKIQGDPTKADSQRCSEASQAK